MKSTTILLYLILVYRVAFPQDVKFSIYMDKDTYILGDRVFVNMCVFNNSIDTITCSSFPSFEEKYYSFKFHERNGKPVNQYIISRTETIPTIIPPGGYINKVIDLTYEFTTIPREEQSKPITGYGRYRLTEGSYSFQMTYNLEVYTNPTKVTVQKLESNELHFSILPVTEPVDSLVITVMLAHNNLNYKNRNDYLNALDLAIKNGHKSNLYPMLLNEKLRYALLLMPQDIKQKQIFSSMLEELVNVAPNTQYTAEGFSLAMQYNLLEDKQMDYEKLLEGNLYLFPPRKTK
ncbi:MAG: hypothetical protein HYV28_05170 [Ignavibacteriales bacterium]|nr:hypothetical protein [Ignavibacteriales bacterium]